MSNRNHDDCLVAVKIAGTIHRTWTPRAADAKRYGKALSKAEGIEGILVAQDRRVRQDCGEYRWQTVAHFAHGENLWDQL